MQKQTYGAKDLAALLQVSESKAYQLIRKMNEELEKQGYLVIRGRVPIGYVNERFYCVKISQGGDTCSTISS